LSFDDRSRRRRLGRPAPALRDHQPNPTRQKSPVGSFHGDSQDVIERLTNAPPDSAFPNAAARQSAGALPHHNEIAVDEEVGSNKL